MDALLWVGEGIVGEMTEHGIGPGLQNVDPEVMYGVMACWHHGNSIQYDSEDFYQESMKMCFI